MNAMLASACAVSGEQGARLCRDYLLLREGRREGQGAVVKGRLKGVAWYMQEARDVAEYAIWR